MKTVTETYTVSWPEIDICDNFKFSTSINSETFEFRFKWLNDRWNCWVTLPDGTVRDAGVYPNVVNWTGYNDYGLIFSTDLADFNYNNLFLGTLVVAIWE